LASVIVILILLAGFGYYFVTTSGKISSLNSSLSADNSSITSLQSEVVTLQGSVSGLQANVTSFQQLVAMLHATVSSDQIKIASLNGSLAADKATISSLNAQINTDNALIANLTATVNLQSSMVLVNSQSVVIYGNASTPSPFLTLSPAHAGYLLIQVSGATEGYLVLSSQTPTANNPSAAIFESITGLNPASPGATYFIIPVVPGSGTTFALIAVGSADGSATVTASYYY